MTWLLALLVHGYVARGWTFSVAPALSTDDTPATEWHERMLDEGARAGRHDRARRVCPRVEVPVPVEDLDAISAERIAELLRHKLHHER